MPVVDESYAWRLLKDASAKHLTVPATLGADGPDAPVIDIDTGSRWATSAECTPAARALLDSLLPVALGGPRFVIAQLGQSLDGRIATESGHSHYVTGEASRIHLHRLRALADAVVVGAGTVAADDPKLTVRHVDGANPVRVVLDPRSRLPRDRDVFTSHDARTLHLVSSRAPDAPVEQIALAGAPGAVAPTAILDALAARGLNRVLVEGGGITISRFLETGCLDRLHVVVAPLIIGSGRPAVAMTPIDRLDTALRPSWRSQPMGDDMFFDLDVR